VTDRPVPWSDAEPDEAQFLSLLSRSATRCPPPELVQAAREGVLPQELQARVTAHADRCPLCSALAEATTDIFRNIPADDERARILRKVLRGGEPSGNRRAWGLEWLLRPPALASIAATTVLAGWGVVALSEIARDGTRPDPPPLVRPVSQPPRPSVLTLEKAPGPTFNFAVGTVLWRGDETGSPPTTNLAQRDEARELLRALEPYERNDFTEAARRLRVLTSERPENANAHLYLGISELFEGRAAEATSALAAAERLAGGDVDVSSNAQWYLALAYRRVGQSDRARAMLEQLCRRDTVRGALACAALLELSRTDEPAR
jgi:tetratricopeptide (TPR) repeat protein